MLKKTSLTSLFVLALSSAPIIAIGGPAMPPAVVQVVTAQPAEWQQKLSITGSLTALQGIMLKPEIAGRITEIYFQPGQFVQKGTPLLAMNQAILKAKLQLNEANLKLSQQKFERAKILLRQHAVSKEDYDTAQANLTMNQAQVDQAKAELEQAIIRAPFSGKLGLNLVNVGDYVTEGQNLVNLQALNPIVVNFNLPENYLSKIKVGDTVAIRSDAYPKESFTGKVYASDSVVNSENRSLAIRASVPNPDNKLLPGMFMQVDLGLGDKTPVLAIPQIALLSSLQGNYVYRALNGKAIKTPVVVLARNNQTAYIKSGLNAGDVVVTDGQFKITNSGEPIAIAK